MSNIRITRKKYEKAQAAVAAAEKQTELVQQWESAIQQIDTPKQVDAITIHNDGSIRFELVHSGGTA